MRGEVKLTITLCVVGAATAIGTMAGWIKFDESRAVQIEHRNQGNYKGGPIYYIHDPRGDQCFAVTSPGMSYETRATVECTPAIMRAVEEDRSLMLRNR